MPPSPAVTKVRHITAGMQHRAVKRLFAKRRKRMAIGELDKTRTPSATVARRYTAKKLRKIRSGQGRKKLHAAIRRMKD